MVMMTTMMNRISLLVFFITCTTFSISAQESDFGIWANVDAEVSLSKKFDLEFSGSVRSYNKTSEIEQAFLEGGVKYSIWKFLSVAASYRYINKLENNGFYYGRHKFFTDINGSVSAGNFGFSGRVRLQRTTVTYIETEEDKIARYHLRLRVKADYRGSSSVFKPYLSFEPFIPVFNGANPSIGKYRLSAGSELFLTQKSSIDIGYILERDFKPVQINLHILNIGYKIRF
jgi:hypothetical protein